MPGPTAISPLAPGRARPKAAVHSSRVSLHSPCVECEPVPHTPDAGQSLSGEGNTGEREGRALAHLRLPPECCIADQERGKTDNALPLHRVVESVTERRISEGRGMV
jgi:hypothetical protein